MARIPKQVPKTSGQGVSRKSYQMGRSLGMSGTGSAGGGVKAPAVTSAAPPPSPIVRSTAGTGGGGFASGKQDYGKAPLYSEREFPNPTLKALGATPTNKSKAAKGFVF